jgi:bacterioferritin
LADTQPAGAAGVWQGSGATGRDGRRQGKTKEEHHAPKERAMKGNPRLLKTLNSLLADELTAVNEYMVHSEMCDNWGYEKLHKAFEKRAVDEMKHAEKLIGRILFLEGQPIVSKLGEITIGQDVPKQLANDLALEMGAIAAYNKAIALAAEVADNATKELLDNILKDEDVHVDEIEEKQDQIKQMGLQIFLTTQVE